MWFFDCSCIHCTLRWCTYSCEMYGISWYLLWICVHIHSMQGHAADSDNDGASVPCLELFLRLMREEKWVLICLAAALITTVHVCISWLFQVQGSAVRWYFCRVCIQEGATVDNTAAGHSKETAANHSITVVSNTTHHTHTHPTQDIHSRLVYGSDYPIPAINLVVHTSRLKR